MPDVQTLAEVISEPLIRRLAGRQFFERGLNYFQSGHVLKMRVRKDRLDAEVMGRYSYEVTLRVRDGRLDSNCDCPLGEEGEFCKHCVAAALYWLEQQSHVQHPGPRAKVKQKRKELTLDEAILLLEKMPAKHLLPLLRDWAERDELLAQRLVHQAAMLSGPEASAAALEEALRTALEVEDFVAWDEASSWAQGVTRVLDSLEALTKGDQAEVVIPLCEQGLRLLDAAVSKIHDDGEILMLQQRIEQLHLAACEIAKPDQKALALRLFDFKLSGDLVFFDDALQKYAVVLGKKGREALEARANAEWEKVLQSGAKPDGGNFDRFAAITGLMEELAIDSGDVERLVAIMSRDLTSCHSYLRIAEVYLEAGDHEKALHWAEDGMSKFSDPVLRDFAAAEYKRNGETAKALELLWPQFEAHPGLTAFLKLKAIAKGDESWPIWRSRAIATIEQDIAMAGTVTPGGYSRSWPKPGPDHSRLVEIYLHEGMIEEAWNRARSGGCSQNHWLKLAEVLDVNQPELAVPIFQRLAEETIASTTNGDYVIPVSLLEQSAISMKRMDLSVEFEHYLDELLLKFKAKRNFGKLVRDKSRTLYLSKSRKA